MSGLVWPEPGLRALVDQRARVHGVYRVVARSYGANAAFKGVGRRDRVAAVAVSATVDLVTGWLLRSSDRLGWPARLAVDVVDTAAWGARAPGSPEAAMLAGVPLAVETGLRRGPVGLGIPAAHLLASWVVRRRRGLATPASSVFGQVQAATFGAVLSWYQRRRVVELTDQHRDEAAARAEAARLAGQHDVAMDADSLVDQVAGLEYLLAVAAGDDVVDVGSARLLAQWKSSLAGAAGAGASYLAVVTSRWASARRGNVLSEDVAVEVSDLDGVTLLSRSQADRLAAVLDAIDPRGRCAVAVVTPRQVLAPGRALHLRVDGHDVRLPADPQPGLRLVDPAPVLAFAGIGWCMALSGASHGRAPWVVTGAASSLSVVLALWTHRRIVSGAALRPARLVDAAVAVSTLQALAVGATLRDDVDPDGVQVIPVALTMMASGLLAGRYHAALGRRERFEVLGAFALGTMVSALPLRSRMHPVHLALGAVEVLAAYLMLSQVQDALEQDRAKLAADLGARSEVEAELAFETGRRTVLDMVRDTVERLRVDLAGADLPEGIAAEAARRLTAAEQQLAGMR